MELERSVNDLRILSDYTYKRRVAELESEVEQAKMALERTVRQARANNTQAEARLKARTSEYKRQVSKQTKIEGQISKCRIIAPADGLVISLALVDDTHRKITLKALGPRGRELLADL